MRMTILRFLIFTLTFFYSFTNPSYSGSNFEIDNMRLKKHDAQIGERGLFANERIVSSGKMRRYRLFVPENYKPGKPIGLLFGFQGWGDPEHDYFQKNGFEDIAGDKYWITVSMNLNSDKERAINEMNSKSNPDITFVIDVYNKIQHLYIIDNNRVFASGHSYGANFVEALAFFYPDMFAAINLNFPIYTEDLSKTIEPPEGAKFSCIGAGGLKCPFKTGLYIQTLAEKYQKLGLDADCYIFNTSYSWAPSDAGTIPEMLFTETVARYFLKHPKNFREKTFTPVLTAKPFNENFSGSEGLLNSSFWQIESFREDGTMGISCGYAFKEENGFLEAHALDKGIQGGVCTTDFFRNNIIWRTSFIIDSRSDDLDIFPVLLRDVSGSILFLSIEANEWNWKTASTHQAFRSLDNASVKTVQNGKFTFETGREYIVEFRYCPSMSWVITNLDGEIITRGVLPDPGIIGNFAELGFGLRGTNAKARFNYVEAAESESTPNKDMETIMLIGYYESFNNM